MNVLYCTRRLTLDIENSSHRRIETFFQNVILQKTSTNGYHKRLTTKNSQKYMYKETEMRYHGHIIRDKLLPLRHRYSQIMGLGEQS